MATQQTRREYFESQEGQDIKRLLTDMAEDGGFYTRASFSPDTTKYPDNFMPFVDKHLAYLSAHPNLDARMYIANLKMMTRVR